MESYSTFNMFFRHFHVACISGLFLFFFFFNQVVFHLFIHLSNDGQMDSFQLCVLWVKLLFTLSKTFCGHKFSFLLQ